MVTDVAFPSTVPGLPADQPWVSIPVRRWLTEPGIDPVAISACFAPACREPAAVGLFRASGRDGAALGRAASDPAGLLALLSRQPDRLPARGRKPPVPARVAAEPAREAGLPGMVVRLSRPDGSRPVAGYILALERGGRTDLLVIVAASESAARALARSVAPHLGA